jgi:undecaprenyl phosphate-alpha-L-ara4FN deformylase
MTTLGLRIDVDTLRGTREGVPRLLELLEKHEVSATFFFSVGPDNMGRHLWRLLDPRFAYKMLRSRAASLYGWQILLAGTCWPGRVIAREAGDVIKAADRAGHEIGLHAWDHHRWQARAENMNAAELHEETQRGYDALAGLLGRGPDCSAAAGWKTNAATLTEKESFGFRYNSDCRGHCLFVPMVDGRPCTVQIPTTLPTFDEMIGADGTTVENYNERLLGMVRADRLNVLTIHAEVEGIVHADLFDEFLDECRRRSIEIVPLGTLLEAGTPIPQGVIVPGHIAGRAGTLAWQRPAANEA